MKSTFYNFLQAIAKAKEKPLFSISFKCENALDGSINASIIHGYYNLYIDHPILSKSYVILDKEHYNRKLIMVLSKISELSPHQHAGITVKHTVQLNDTVYGLPQQTPGGPVTQMSGGLTLPVTLEFTGCDISAYSEYNCESITIPVHQLFLLVSNNLIGKHLFEQNFHGYVYVETIKDIDNKPIEGNLPRNLLVNNQSFLYIPYRPQIFTITSIGDKITGFILKDNQKVYIDLPRLFIAHSLQTLSQLWVICEGDEPRIIKVLKEVNE